MNAREQHWIKKYFRVGEQLGAYRIARVEVGRGAVWLIGDDGKPFKRSIRVHRTRPTIYVSMNGQPNLYVVQSKVDTTPERALALYKGLRGHQEFDIYLMREILGYVVSN